MVVNGNSINAIGGACNEGNRCHIPTCCRSLSVTGTKLRTMVATISLTTIDELPHLQKEKEKQKTKKKSKIKRNPIVVKDNPHLTVQLY